MEANLRALGVYALPLSRAGRIPLAGEWGGALRLLDRCVRLAKARGLTVFRRVDDVPGWRPA